MTFDDSALFHGGTYDPAKAHQYYLRTRKLKGRRPGVARVSSQRTGTKPTAQAVPAGTKPNRADTKSRRAELEAQKVALEKRLDRLREVLRKLVDEAQARSGVKKPGHDVKDAAPETQVDKADRNQAEKSRKPLTASQKREKAQKAKETYEKEHPNTLSQDVDILKLQVEDMHKKIQTALENARRRTNGTGKPSAAVVGPNDKGNSGTKKGH